MDIFYSKRTLAFRNYCTMLLMKIIREEVGVQARGRRFVLNSHSYPIHLVVFLEKSRLGYCNPVLFEIGINSLLMDADEPLLLNVLRHELAHLLTFLKYGPVEAHGKEFRALCASYGWENEVSHASVFLENAQRKRKIGSKVQKLLSLAASPHPEEALAALQKAQQLINHYALEEQREEEEWFSRRVLHTKRLDQKFKTIASILREFHVIPTFHSYSGGVYLDIFGAADQIEYGEQIAHFLNVQLEILWNAQETLQGSRQKKGFFLGIALGFSNGLTQKERALLHYDSSLAHAYRMFTMKGSSVSGKYCADKKSLEKGQKEGKHLCIPKAAPPSFIPGIQWQRAPIYNIPPDL